MKTVRKILVKILGLKGYLRLISRVYITLISWGFQKEKYAELFFIRSITKPGDTVLDIGANLGYYSYFLAKNIGKEGKLLAVEPIPLFAEIWKKNMAKYAGHQTKLFNCALGNEEQEKIPMSIPVVNGVVRHGLTKVNTENESDDTYLRFEVPMHIGDRLLEPEMNQPLAFIKCDVEGYEQFVIPSLDQIIATHKPVLQVELGGEENKQNVVDYLLKNCYKIFILKGQKLAAIQKKDIFSINQDFYFIHEDKLEDKKDLIHN